MMKQIIQFGCGNVGLELINLVKNNDGLIYKGIIDSSGCFFDENGINKEELGELIQKKKNNGKLPQPKEKIIESIKNSENCVVVDVTASDEMNSVLLEAVKNNFVVLANKIPLCGPINDYKELTKDKRIKYEATVGAGLPIISTILSMIETGDEIEEINGCFSGSLGFILSKLKEKIFSECVKEAKKLGYTEPDPRDDLSGMDVARKALILARLLGNELELKDVKVESLIGPKFNEMEKDEFLDKVSKLDDDYKEKFGNAQKNGNVLKYIANIKDGNCEVSLKEAGNSSQIGQLEGTDNIISIKSKRYQRPLTIIGRGAGAEVTAAAVYNDILELK